MRGYPRLKDREGLRLEMTCGGTRVWRGSQVCPLAGGRSAMLQVLTIGMYPAVAPSGSAQPGSQEMQSQERGRREFGDFGPPREDPSPAWRAHWTGVTLCPGMERNPTSREWSQGPSALQSALWAG